jgi:8-oxo-dGTP pyrophosphatase MutT (NUDIX family)
VTQALPTSPLAATRLNPIPTRLRSEAGRPAAVLVGLMADASGWQVIMTERAAHLAHHAGQISFPGGKVDESDTTLVATALREADEEIALPATEVEILGGLDPVSSPVGFIVQPVVGIVAPQVTLQACPDEVARILILPLADLISPPRHRRESYIREGRRREVWVIDHPDHYIWGLSAAIIVDLAARVAMSPPMTGTRMASPRRGA